MRESKPVNLVGMRELKILLIKTVNLVCKTRKCHNYPLQTNPWHHEEEATNNNSKFICLI